jgi:FkbM family methyltransferase
MSNSKTNPYHFKMGLKTQLLNIFRRVFTFYPLEKLLLFLHLRFPNKFLEKLIPLEYLYPHGSIRKVTRNGINYQLDISKNVDHFYYWGYPDISHHAIINDIQSSGVIIDVGANIGSMSLLYAKLNPSALIYAFEPHPDLFKIAQHNLSLNPFKNIHLFNKGLGNKQGVLKLYEVNEHNPGMNRIVADELDAPFREIEIIQLDAFIMEQQITSVDLIKIDVEGFEYAVLEGAMQTLKKHTPTLILELDDTNLKANKSSAQQVVDLLASLGYNQFYDLDTQYPITPESDFKNCHLDLIAKKLKL